MPLWLSPQISQVCFTSLHSHACAMHLLYVASYKRDLWKSSYWSYCPFHVRILTQFNCPVSIAEAHVTLFLQLRTNYCSHVAHSALMYSCAPLQCVFSSVLACCVLSGDCFLCLLCPCICLYVCTHVYHPCTYTMSYDFTSWFETVVQRLK